ncbi:SRPBCC family protein [Paraflavitalea sp. CAU 1676]|uniref:SRPBCC family protein n=1 Tax=Paraflavitalea sp. CAU 1676 TaxID=3032598 RepID=UPI0023DB4C3E|nr:SRPBCC family protein [Paraflavitalea sp. CAU 1676]MDF2190696.1 SRPBCC family protein [Paraflavitalea sp. CAU 1676]
MSVHTIRSVQLIPISPATAWEFFSSPHNLQAITPGDVHFRIISTLHGNRIYPGQIIEYRIKPFWGIEWYWMTEITHVEEGKYFADEQRYGPYSLWHHQHHFRDVPGGLEMTDIVHYKVRGGWMGDMLVGWLVKKKLRQIFDFRYKKIEELFGKWEQHQ